MEWLEFQDSVIGAIPEVKQGLYYEAKTLGTYDKAIKFVKQQKNDGSTSYSASPEEIVQLALWNTICDEVAIKLLKEAKAKTIKD